MPLSNLLCFLFSTTKLFLDMYRTNSGEPQPPGPSASCSVRREQGNEMSKTLLSSSTVHKTTPNAALVMLCPDTSQSLCVDAYPRAFNKRRVRPHLEFLSFCLPFGIYFSLFQFSFDFFILSRKIDSKCPPLSLQ